MIKKEERNIEKVIKIGDSAYIVVNATDDLVRAIAKVSGDINPVHLSEDYAQNTIFGKRIAHGLLCVNGVSQILGTVLPGEGTILISQSFQYKAPVYIGDTVKIEMTVTGEKQEKKIYILSCTCRNQNGKIVMEGECVVKWDK